MAARDPSRIDRQTTTPFLLRLFFKQGSFHRYLCPCTFQSHSLNCVDSTNLTLHYHDSPRTFRSTHGKAVPYANYANYFCRLYPHSFHNHTPVLALRSAWFTQTYRALTVLAHQDASCLEILGQSLSARGAGMTT
jgi:hypothetical protein